MVNTRCLFERLHICVHWFWKSVAWESVNMYTIRRSKTKKVIENNKFRWLLQLKV